MSNKNVIITFIEYYHTEEYDLEWPIPEPPDEASFEPEFIPSDADVLDNLTATQKLARHALFVSDELDYSLEYPEETYPPDEDKQVVFNGELLDGSETVPFFEGVVIQEDENGVRFTVPERFIKSEEYGIFGLEVSGELKRFKEYDDYGNIRFLQKDGEVTGAIWLPHLYPFEAVDPKTHLPEIRDRERCLVEVGLRSLTEDHEIPHMCEIAIHTEQGIFAALPAIDLSYGSGGNYYNEFHWFEHNAVAQHVEWPDIEMPSVTEFLEDVMATDPDRVKRLLRKEEEFPPQFTTPHIPLGYETRKSWDNSEDMQAVGQIWVPLDELRRGIEAEIEFPLFQI